ncbi:MAG: hypothetical protein Q4G18_00285 [Myroides sp.]|nr:hypothetical protein [Myroides sp.]
MKYLLLLVTALISVTSFAQKQFVNCETQKPISNLMVFDTDQNYIGITNEKGIIEKELLSQQIIINHPEYGNQTVDITKDRICIDFFNDELDELFIEKGLHVQKELLQALEISFKAFSDEKSGKSIYKISDNAYVNNVLNESLFGYLKIDTNGKSIRYLDPHYKFTEYIHKKEYNHYINPSYTPMALYEQIFPLHNRKDYKEFISMINESETSKSGNYYYIDLPKIENFITIEIDPKSKKINRISFPKVQKDGRGKFKEGYIQYTNTEMFFDTQSTYKMTSLELKNYYEIEGKKVRYDFKAAEVNLPKKEVSAMKSVGFGGIGLNDLVSVYMKQRRTYNYEKLGIDGNSPWYYK